MLRAWVIGGRRGLGEEISKLLTARDIEVTSTDEDDANVVSTRQLHQAFEDIIPSWIVYCAGINQIMPADRFDEFTALNMLDINALGFMRVVRIAAEARAHRQPSSIVAIGSDAARIPMRNSMAYCASKAALHAAVRCAARELAPHIRVNAVAPGTIEETPMTQAIDRQVELVKGWESGEARGHDQEANPMGRRAAPHEIAHVVYTVLDGPHYMTGSIIEVNGGR